VDNASSDPTNESDDDVKPTEKDPRLRRLLGGFVCLIVLANVSSFAAPALVERSPELLIAMSSRIRHLLFANTAGIHPIAYAAIGTIRLSIAASICFMLGYWYGDRGTAWVDEQLGGETPALLRWTQKGVEKAASVLVFLMPGSNVVCVLVGSRKMNPKRFAICLVAGILFRLAWVWLAAKRFEPELKDALAWIARYQWRLVGGFFAITMVQSYRRASRQQKNHQPDTD
jgi:membrane protein DedA with SNARE-associated domain